MTRESRSRRPDWWPRLEWPDFVLCGLFLAVLAVECAVIWIVTRWL